MNESKSATAANDASASGGKANDYGIHTMEKLNEGDDSDMAKIMKEIRKVPDEDAEVLVMCLKVKGDNRPLVALAGSNLEIAIAISVLIEEARNRDMI